MGQDRARLAAIVDSSDDAIISKDLKGIVRTWNKAAGQLFGYAAEEMIGKSITLLIPADRFSEEKSILARLRRGEQIDHYETVRKRKDGSLVEVSISVAPIRDSTDRVVGASKIVRDISERNRAAAALLKSERRLRAIVETAVDAIITIDERGTIESVNQATQRLFGYRAEEMLGQNVRMLMPEPYHGEHDQYLRNYLRTGHAKIIGIGREVTALRKDGTMFPINLSVSEASLPGSKRLFTGIIHDLTSRRQLEAQIVEASVVEQRRIGQDLHDGLCQDLVGLAFGADAIARRLKTKALEEVEEVEKLAASARKAASDARQLSHGLNPVDLKAGGLPAALEALCDKVSEVFGVRCIFHWDRVPTRHDDATATHLFRIAQEATSNAIRHGKAKRVEIELKCNLNRLQLTVKDNGIGFERPSARKSTRSARKPQHESPVRHGIGVQGMRYRAHLIGGTFDLRPGKRGGMVATCSIDTTCSPLPAINGARR
jgi:hypothetical protein